MTQYVLVRIMTLREVDLNLFQFDRHNALYFFIMNADEHIYMRYGGRDARSAMSYLDFDSLELALSLGLEEHARYQQGQIERIEKGEPLYPDQIVTLKEGVIDRGRCTECHLVQDYIVTEKEAAGTLDKLVDMYVSPDIRNLGIELNVPRGLELAEALGPAAAAGMQTGDVITAINGTRVLTFGDLQFHYNQVNRLAHAITMDVRRGDEVHSLDLDLPERWWFTDLSHRYWTVDPLMFFEAETLTADEKTELDLPLDGFASRVTVVDIDALLEGAHDLEEGDIIVSVDGVKRDDVVQDVITHIKLRHRAGDSMTLGVLRGDLLQDMPLNTKRQRFRKTD